MDETMNHSHVIAPRKQPKQRQSYFEGKTTIVYFYSIIFL